ncbi:MAG: response regulator transcription factor [Firmicutes bacterium]|nr:response regulator transcription factor [Bacillota bacterium]
MSLLRVMVVDDHPLFRKGLVELIGEQPDLEVVGEGGSCAEAVAKAEQLRPDVIIMDLRLPDATGIDATRRLLAVAPGIRVIMLTVSETDEDVFSALQAGASGYLLKDVEPEDLLRSIRQAAGGRAPLAGAVATRLIRGLARGGVKSSGKRPPGPLSSRETEIIALVAEGYTNKEIGNELGIAENTVKIHLKHIISKLGVRNRVEAAMRAKETGLILRRNYGK